ncbi:capsule polysaccharide export protein [Moorella thermoacetica Y72]|uniref:Capsule polysaccharide export protein n=1 Tax=Moorella thermoacetica Y72 TaxID=1325331 RepID=A0A0S6UFN4_NEOTH|nr:capsule polysaccharide export protein [Moorella thermoacetica Y72]
MDVDLDDLKTGHSFDGLFHILLDLDGHIGNADAEIDYYVQVYGSFLFANLDFDALGQVLPAQEFGNTPGNTAAHAGYTFNLRGRQAGNDSHHLIGDLNGAQVSFGLLFQDLIHPAHLHLFVLLLYQRLAATSTASL